MTLKTRSSDAGDTTESEPLTISVEAAGKLLGLSRTAAYNAVERGEIPSLKFGRRIVVPRKRLEALIYGT